MCSPYRRGSSDVGRGIYAQDPRKERRERALSAQVRLRPNTQRIEYFRSQAFGRLTVYHDKQEVTQGFSALRTKVSVEFTPA